MTRRSWFAVLSVVAYAWSSVPPTFAGEDQTTPATWAHVTITLERTRCFGTCPAYLVTVDEKGNVIYRGQEYVRVKGEQRTQIDPARIAALVAEFQRIKFFDLQAVYTANVTDNPTTYVSISLDGVSKRVTDYFSAPAALRQLEQQIDEVTNTRHWVYLDPPVVKEIQESAAPMPQATLDAELQQAIGRDDIETVQALLDTGASARGDQGPSLRSARSAAMVRLLVAAGAPVDPPAGRRVTPLMQAAAYADVSVVEALLKAGARADGGEGWTTTPLIQAAAEGRVATVEALLTAGANPRARDASFKTAMDQATGNCQIRASLSARTPAGFVPLVTADDCRKIIALLQAALAK